MEHAYATCALVEGFRMSNVNTTILLLSYTPEARTYSQTVAFIAFASLMAQIYTIKIHGLCVQCFLCHLRRPGPKSEDPYT